MPVRLTKEQILSIVEMRKDGIPNKEIQTRLGTSASTLFYWINRLKKAGHKIKRQAVSGRPKLDLTTPQIIQQG